MKPPYSIKNVPKNIQLITEDNDTYTFPLESFNYLNINNDIIYGKGDNNENMKIKMILNKEANKKEYARDENGALIDNPFFNLEAIMDIKEVNVEYEDGTLRNIDIEDPVDSDKYLSLPPERQDEAINQDGIYDDNGNMIVTIKK